MTSLLDLTPRAAGALDADPTVAFERPATAEGRCFYTNTCSGTECNDFTSPG